MRRVLECVDWIGAQSASDAERFRNLGANPERVMVTGNVKFDGKPPGAGALLSKSENAIRGAERGPVMVAASTMAGEELLLIPAWKEIRRLNPKALLVLAPRHPARFDQVAQLLSRQGLSCVRRSALAASEGDWRDLFASCEVFLLDSVGELAGIFALADLVFMGGSLVPTGGHNLLEPAFWSQAVVFGPHMENFRDVAALFLNHGAAMQVRNSLELGAVTCELLRDEPRRRQMGEAAKQILERESGATQRILEQLRPWLEKPAAAVPSPRLLGSRAQ